MLPEVSPWVAIVVAVIGSVQFARIVLGVVALLKADRKDVPAIVRALARWGKGR
ncbi:hypothetical protein ACIG5D_37755 [Microbispora rosea]|uniref:hypothetical protein n=1 Tax=Microbispora rosea TaxID=58117 RepID=UPI0037C93CA3